MHSLFRLPMNRSTTAMLPFLPTAPKRGSMSFRSHQSLKLSHQNCFPLSVIRYFGLLPAFRMVRFNRDCRAPDEGHALNTQIPTTLREKWSRMTLTHQQNGHCCGSEYGDHDVQNPEDVGITVRSTFQTWLGRFAITTWPEETSSSSGSGILSSLRICPTVISPRCKPARHRVSAIRTFPISQLPINSLMKSSLSVTGRSVIKSLIAFSGRNAIY